MNYLHRYLHPVGMAITDVEGVHDVHECPYCGEEVKTLGGFTRHRRACDERPDDPQPDAPDAQEIRLPTAIPSAWDGRLVGVLGMPGSGKTVDLAEVVLGAPEDQPILVVDPGGAMAGYTRGSDAWIVDFPLAVTTTEREEAADDAWPRTVEWLQEGDTVVWDMSTWDPPWVQDLLDAATQRFRQMEDFALVVDEMHSLVSETRYGGGARKFERWISQRRNQGVSLFWSSQRPAFVSQGVRGLTDWSLWHRLQRSVDLKALKHELKDVPNLDRAPARWARINQGLPTGDAIRVAAPFSADDVGTTVDLVGVEPVRTRGTERFQEQQAGGGE